MPIIHDSLEGWRIRSNRQCGAPYHVEKVGRFGLLMVADAGGMNAVVGPKGSCLFASRDMANTVCDLANTGELLPDTFTPIA